MVEDMQKPRPQYPGVVTFWVTLYDALLGGLCMYGVIQARYVFAAKPVPEYVDIWASLIFIAACIIVWNITRVNKAIWRFMSFDDVPSLVNAVFLASLITPLTLFLFFDRATHFPRSAPFIAGFLFFFLLVVSRAVVLFYKNGDIRALFRSKTKSPPALLIGPSQALHDFLRDKVGKDNGYSHHIMGLIETEGGHKGRSIRGIPVSGNLADISTIAGNIERQYGLKPTLILVEHRTNRKKAAALVKLASEMGATLVRVGLGRDAELTPFEAADLIGRPTKALDMAPVHAMIKGKRVLITGAGGTIGSELVRQVVCAVPKHLVLIDASEMSLYSIERFCAAQDGLSYSTYLGNVCDRAHMDEIFGAEKPQVILHAAALKHVPLMETNPIETVITNVGGTKICLEMAMAHGAQSFTLISTDKAVSPTNIMGASKRIAEMLTMATGVNKANISASAVRFGNVLASNGSVVPLFERQIEEGGPVTVTDQNATRYFMTTREAAGLVLQASALNSVQSKDISAIYVLDMGKPVNIAHLARQLIRLRGFVPDRDIAIQYTGLRPGEKLTEELTGVGENLEKTTIQGISRFTGRISDPRSVDRRIDKLLKAAQTRDRKGVRKALAALVPEFEPNGGLS